MVRSPLPEVCLSDVFLHASSFQPLLQNMFVFTMPFFSLPQSNVRIWGRTGKITVFVFTLYPTLHLVQGLGKEELAGAAISTLMLCVLDPFPISNVHPVPSLH